MCTYKVSRDDCGIADADDVVAHGSCELGADASLGPEVPDPQGPVVAGADKLLGVFDELGRQDLLVVAGEGVAELQVVSRPHPAGEVAVRGRQEQGAGCSDIIFVDKLLFPSIHK